MEGIIFNIQRCCYNDGPGVRTTVFFKGCSLNCLWCHNPESHKIEPEIMFNADNCVNCMRCIGVCKQGCHKMLNGRHLYDRTACVVCGNCTKLNCGNLEIIGYKTTVEDVMTEIIKDKPFYDASGGGITLSGGEPFYQPDFALELMKKAKENGINICVETCGFASKEVLKKSAEFVDIYLFDCKETDSERHKQFTGVDNNLILENLKMLDNMGKKIILRCPIIPGYNDNENHFMGIVRLADSLQNILSIEVEPYHNAGSPKYKKLGFRYSLTNMQNPDETTVKTWINNIQSNTGILVKNA